MTSPLLTASSLESFATHFFQQSAGQWHSQRRYYTLNPTIETQEVESEIQVRFLRPDSPELDHLAQLHGLSESQPFVCGSHVSWQSSYLGQTRKPGQGETLFGVRGNLLYRDRGFATPQPITALYHCANAQTMTLRSEYSGSVFEEELKLISQQYRTRQTIISRAGEEQMIGQYLEKRLSSDRP